LKTCDTTIGFAIDFGRQWIKIVYALLKKNIIGG